MSETNSLGNFLVEHRSVDKLDPLIVRPQQTHSGNIVEAAAITPETEADGIVIHSTATTPAVIMTADCMPLALIGDDTAVLLHVSRKSIIKDLVYNAKQHLPPTKIRHVYIGPHICPKHFTFNHIGEELQQFCRQFPGACDLRKPIRVSLRQAVQQYLSAWNITADKITEAGRCTYEDENLPSYRRSLDSKQELTQHLVTTITGAPAR